MKTRGKICWAGAGLLVAGTALAVTGAALLTSAFVTWSVERIRNSAPEKLDRTFAKLESASSNLGTVAGRVQHHVHRAATVARKAGQGAIKGFAEGLAQK
jgi:hypothetical protein